jgi:hypothetical protein
MFMMSKPKLGEPRVYESMLLVEVSLS